MCQTRPPQEWRTSTSYLLAVWRTKILSTSFLILDLSHQFPTSSCEATNFPRIALSHQFLTSSCETTSFPTIALSHQLQTSICKTTVVLLNRSPGHFNTKLWLIRWRLSPEGLHWVHSGRRVAPHLLLSHRLLPLLARATSIPIC